MQRQQCKRPVTVAMGKQHSHVLTAQKERGKALAFSHRSSHQRRMVYISSQLRLHIIPQMMDLSSACCRSISGPHSSLTTTRPGLLLHLPSNGRQKQIVLARSEPGEVSISGASSVIGHQTQATHGCSACGRLPPIHVAVVVTTIPIPESVPPLLPNVFAPTRTNRLPTWQSGRPKSMLINVF